MKAMWEQFRSQQREWGNGGEGTTERNQGKDVKPGSEVFRPMDGHDDPV